MSPPALGLKFYRWYAWNDLTEHDAKRSTIAVVGTLAAVQTLALLMLGLTQGYGRAQQERIADDPLALSLFAGSRMRPDGVTDEILERLRGRVAEVAPQAQVFPLERTWLSFEFSPENQRAPQERMSFKGRTIQPGDPILRSYQLNDDLVTQFGVIVTPMFLQEYGGDAPPHLIMHASGSDDLTTEVPVLGATDKDLPEGYRFLINEDCLAELEAIQPATSMQTGRVPEAVFEWRRWDDGQVEAMRTALSRRSVRGAPQLVGDFDPQQLFWRLESETSSGLSKQRWTEALTELREVLSQQGIALPPEFVSDAREQSRHRELPPQVYDSVELLASASEELPLLGGVLEEVGLPYDRDIVDQLISITRITNALSALLGFIAVLVIVFSGFNIYTILAQRADHKSSEVGMLKAMGMTPHQLLRLYFVEGFYLWAAGAVLALGLSMIIGFSTQLIWNAIVGETAIKFHCPWWLPVATVALSGLVSVICSVRASASSRSASPAHSLSVAA